MKVIVGLGNPESRYKLTRHNVGFLVIDHLVARLNASPTKPNKNSVLFEVNSSNSISLSGGDKVLLVKPQTYMNLSGKAVLEIMSFYKVKVDDLLIVTDEVDLLFGTTKLLQGRGHGGHNGLRSIIDLVGKNFPRLRVGIGQSRESTQISSEIPAKIPLDRFVLANFSPAEQEELPSYLDYIGEIVLSFIDRGIKDTMTQYNKRFFRNI